MILKLALNEINKAAYNPRISLKEENTVEFEKLKRSIEEFGYVNLLTVNVRENGEYVLVGGHQRYDALMDLYGPENVVDVNLVKLSIDKEKALNLALNKINGDWNEYKLKEILKELEETDFVELTGFDEVEIAGILNEIDDYLNMGDDEEGEDLFDEEEDEDFTFDKAELKLATVKLVLTLEEKEIVESFIARYSKDNIRGEQYIVNMIKEYELNNGN